MSEPDGDAVSRLDEVLRRCEDQATPIRDLLQVGITDCADLARDFRTVAEALRAAIGPHEGLHAEGMRIVNAWLGAEDG